MKGVEMLLVHLESLEYLKENQEDVLLFRAIRKNIECVEKNNFYNRKCARSIGNNIT